MALVFHHQNPLHLVRSWGARVLEGDEVSPRVEGVLLRWDHGRLPSWGPVSAPDVALALLVAVLSFFSFLERASLVFETEDGPLRYREPDLLGAALLLAGCAALAWRRSFPGLVLAIAALAAVARNAAGYPLAPLPYAVMVATFAVGLRWPLPQSAEALVPVVLGMAASALARFGPAVDDEVLSSVLAVLAAWVLGRWLRLHRMRTRLLEDRALLLEERARHLAQEQSAVAALAAAQERATIARELHDVVANDVAVIVARAGSARRCAPADGGGWAEVLTSIESLGRDALRDMRRLVGVLRSIDDVGDSPTPGLDQLEELVARMAGAGTAVELSVTGSRRRLAPTVELNAYRIVQESLTNAMRHASGSPATVCVDFGEDRLHLVVRDLGGHETSPDAPGTGLVGMRQRVALLGGSLRAGPAPQGGFVVDCVLPLTPGEVARDSAGAHRR